MRITEHPILEFERSREITFSFDGRPIRAYRGETIAAALHAAGIRVITRSKNGRPRGLFCAIGKCSSCLVTVDGIPNVKSCVTLVREGMDVRSQRGPGAIDPGFRPRPRPPWPELETEVTIVGGGPAGLAAAQALLEHGLRPLIVDENPHPGGQLVKQTHKFFGSRRERAGTRGVEIASELTSQVKEEATLFSGAQAIGFYRDGDLILALNRDRRLQIVRARRYIIATGAEERFLVFPGNDLPGVYGAGAIQTLMNLYGVRPGNRALIVGAGNVGLIIAYQLLQAGVEVVAVVEAAREIGGYHVHAAKIRRLGVPILTRHSVIRALGEEEVEGAVIAELDSEFNPIPGSERELEVDLIGLAVGLIPSTRLAEQAGAEMAYLGELGGRVPLHGPTMETSVPGLYVAGDCAGIGEASTAMLEGRLAALSILAERGLPVSEELDETRASLARLRSGPFGERPRRGKEKVFALFEELAR